ncbi:MAG: DNA-3-methyladenine glycosylase 2 family protein [Clostridia bacterium]|nr:DNA-3-methyladenine glycosylase 2 family protein [Clostridia bacterium]
MEIIEFSNEYLNIKDTLDCGQIFRYKPFNDGFLVFSGDKVCYVYEQDGKCYIQSEDTEYFANFFDLKRDYSVINNFALSSRHDIVSRSAKLAKGVRILNQQREEMLFSFIISQNNMIPRIKAIIERTCIALGEKKSFDGEEYYTFPTVKALASKTEEFYKNLGYGYRARYIVEVANAIINGDINLEKISELTTVGLKKSLMTLKGVGAKVADCIALFGYHRVDSFPVDTWIERLYREDFKGELTDRQKITEWFLNEFKEYSGYVQQYVFYYKRSLEKNDKN